MKCLPILIIDVINDMTVDAVTAVAAVLGCCSLKAGSILQTVKARWGLSHWTSVFLRRRSSFD